MEYKNVTIGLQIYGVFVRMMYLVSEVNNVLESLGVSSRRLTPRISPQWVPNGRKITYTIENTEYIIYSDIPIIVHNQTSIKIMDEPLYNKILANIISQIRKNGLTLYKDNGILIEYIDDTPLINYDKRINILIADQTPRQDSVRMLLDMSDQVVDPIVKTKLIFQMNDLVDQINVDMKFTYEDKYHRILFYHDEIGFIYYYIITGHMIANLMPIFTLYLQNEYLKNYPNTHSEIDIYLMAMQLDINYLSVMYGL